MQSTRLVETSHVKITCFCHLNMYPKMAPCFYGRMTEWSKVCDSRNLLLCGQLRGSSHPGSPGMGSNPISVIFLSFAFVLWHVLFDFPSKSSRSFAMILCVP